MRVSPFTCFVILSIALPASAEEARFRAAPADSYAHQSAEQVTVGAKSFDTPELTESVFGKKTDLLKYGVLPVLVVIENKGQSALDLQSLEVSLIASDGRHAQAVEPDELFHLGARSKRPGISPIPIPMPRKKNPLESPEIVTRSFTAKMLPPGDRADGFFYFEAKPESGDKLYVNGIRQARSGKELLYFEFPLAQ